MNHSSNDSLCSLYLSKSDSQQHKTMQFKGAEIMPRPLNEQVVVITGASSGIGRAAAFQFVKAGATVVLTARNEMALRDVASRIEQGGGRCLVIPADVSDPAQVRHVAQTAIDIYGRIDTWVNNAGISVYATAEETTFDEARRIMNVNFLGVVNGVTTILPFMKQQGEGTIINVGSVESQIALPLQAVYAASKHAVKAYTDALRMEENYQKSGVKVVLILPSGINTPLFNHARSKIGVKPQPVPPAYPPELAARAIVNAAKSPQREIYVGGSGFFFWLLQRINPALIDRMMTTGGAGFKMQQSDQPEDMTDNLYEPVPEAGRIHGDYEDMTKRSFYTPVFELAPRWFRRLLMVGMGISGTILGRFLVRRRATAR
jgi:short-subunit dehydrogenase